MRLAPLLELDPTEIMSLLIDPRSNTSAVVAPAVTSAACPDGKDLSESDVIINGLSLLTIALSILPITTTTKNDIVIITAVFFSYPSAKCEH